MTHPTAMFFRCLGLACLLVAGVCVAQPSEEPIDSGVLSERSRLEVEQTGGFIVDRTMTNFGADFVREFSAAWREQPGTAAIDVTVTERPSARFGSQIYIEHNYRAIARLFLYAGRSASIKPLAGEAARYVATVVTNSSVTALLANDPDLGPEELR